MLLALSSRLVPLTLSLALTLTSITRRPRSPVRSQAYGPAGVVKAVRILEREIVSGMRLLGVRRIDELVPEMVRPSRPRPVAPYRPCPRLFILIHTDTGGARRLAANRREALTERGACPAHWVPSAHGTWVAFGTRRTYRLHDVSTC